MCTEATAAGLNRGGPASVSPDDELLRQVQQAGGKPRTDFPRGGTPFAAYAQMDALLSLQHPQTDSATELGFIIMSQVKELLFKLLHAEFTAARDHLHGGRVADGLWTLRRSARAQRLLLSSWDMLAALTPVEFAEFREILGSASGFQSSSYRRLEFVLGNKDPVMVLPHRNSPAYDGVVSQLRQPSLYDATLAVLHRRGLQIPPELFERDIELPYQPSHAVESAWLRIYQAPERYWDLYVLGEALMDTADLFARWRYTHLVTVQRLLGEKPGTGGTYGVSWLDRISDHRFFPELWSARSAL